MLIKAVMSIFKKELNRKRGRKGISEVASEALLIATSISLFIIAVLNPITQISNWLGQVWSGINDAVNQAGGNISEGLNWVINQIKSMFGFG